MRDKENETEDQESLDRYRKKIRAVRRWKRMVVFIATTMILIGLGYGAISYTSTSSFCSSCHEMAPQHVTYQASAHNKVQCIQCHIKPGRKNRMLHKMGEIRNLYTHLSSPQSEIHQTMTVSSENCQQCHSNNRLITATGDIIVNHNGHVKKGIPCVTCHSGVVHAKVAERGISNSDTLIAWTDKNAKKLMGEKYEKPNMGTCIDCHERVNQGKKPWNNKGYILPTRRSQSVKEENADYETPETRAGILERDIPENTQKVILEAIGKQHTDVKISMECFTCHREISTPENHESKDWSQGHGNIAVKELDQCLNCHKDALWEKEIGKQDINLLLIETPNSTKVNADLTLVIKESRNNYFCSTCHANRPVNHLDRYKWLTDTHRLNAVTPEERESCFVCHDNERPKGDGYRTTPSDVYCDFCHKGLFRGEPVETKSEK